MADLFTMLPSGLAVDLCTIAAEHNMSVEKVLLDLINGNYEPESGRFYVHFPDRVLGL